MDLDVEVGPGDTEDVVAQQVFRTPPFEHCIELVKQVTVLTAQVEKALSGANRVGSNGHPLEHQVGLPGQQDPVLEGAGLALVGVADNETLLPRQQRCVAAGFPFQAGSEAGATAAAQVGLLDFMKDGRWPAQSGRQALAPGAHVRGLQAFVRRQRPGRQQGLARPQITVEQDVGTTNVVFNREQFRWPLCQRHLGPHQFGNLVDAHLVQPADGQIVDQQRRPLIAQAGT